VEAAGIEPASRDPSTDASTCVVVHLVIVTLAGHDRISLDRALLDSLPIPLARIFSHPPRLEQDGGPTGITADSRTAPAAFLSQGYLYLGGQCEGFFSI